MVVFQMALGRLSKSPILSILITPPTPRTSRIVMTSLLKPLAWIVVGGLLGGITGYRFARPVITPPSHASVTLPTSSRGIRALGSIQPHLGVVDVAIPAGFQVSRLEPKVKEGYEVEQGAVLAILEGFEERS